jgi:hypothetical protein
MKVQQIFVVISLSVPAAAMAANGNPVATGVTAANNIDSGAASSNYGGDCWNLTIELDEAVVKNPAPDAGATAKKDAVPAPDAGGTAKKDAVPAPAKDTTTDKGSGLAPGKLPAGRYFTEKNDGDTLTLIPAKPNRFRDHLGLCKPATGKGTVKASASALVASYSTERDSWAYGPLTIPYRYHLDNHSLDANVNLGAFFGRRLAYGSNAVTGFVSLGVGSVKLEPKNGTTPSAQAVIGAVGLMFDLGSKTNGFKAGFVYGHDRLSTTDAANYGHGKPWIGFEFAYNTPGN